MKGGSEAGSSTETLEEESPGVPGGRPAPHSPRLQSEGAGLEVSGLPVTSTFCGAMNVHPSEGSQSDASSHA